MSARDIFMAAAGVSSIASYIEQINMPSNTATNEIGCCMHTDGTTYLFFQIASTSFHVYKINPNGTEAWKKVYAVGISTNLRGTIDSSGNLYFCCGSVASNLHKIDSTGASVWSKSLSGTGHSQVMQIETDGTNIYVLSRYNNTGTYGGILSKYDSSGNLQWQRGLSDATSTSFMNSISVDSSGNSYITGKISTGYPVLVKYDTNGGLVWQYKMSTTNAAVTYDTHHVAIDPTGTYLYYYFSPSLSVRHIARLSPSNAAVQTQKLIVGNTTSFSVFRGMRVDSSGNLYASILDYNANASAIYGVTAVPSGAIKLDTSLALIWGKQWYRNDYPYWNGGGSPIGGSLLSTKYFSPGRFQLDQNFDGSVAIAGPIAVSMPTSGLTNATYGTIWVVESYAPTLSTTSNISVSSVTTVTNTATSFTNSTPSSPTATTSSNTSTIITVS